MDADKTMIAFIICLLCIGFIFGYELGKSVGKNLIKDDAIEAGAAEWILIDKHGDTEFRWKERIND